MKFFLFICTRHREFGIFNFFCGICDSPLLCKLHYFGKRLFFHEIFQFGACPNFKDSLLYNKFSGHMYKAWSIRFLWLLCAICDPLMPCTVIFFGKRWFFHEIFQAGACPDLKDSSIYDFFLFICTRHRVRYLQLFLRYLRLPNALQGTIFWKKMIFSWNISSWACPNLKDSLFY